MRALLRIVLAACLALAAPLAGASFHLFQIDQMYSNADGSIQYVVLHEFAGANGENFLAGHALTATHNTVTNRFTFDHDLPSGNTAGRRVLIATQGFANLGLAAPDYVIPDRFLPTDGGVLNYAGVDTVAYAALPVDGTNALTRNGTVTPNLATNFAGATAMVPALPVTVVEFYNPALDHYFISPLAPDIEALDTQLIAGWQRTGLSFKVFPSQAAGGPGVNPVCRFLIPPEHGDSHFFSASPDECAAVLGKIGVDPNYSGFIEETPSAFFVALPVTSGPTAGACPPGTVPVYRAFDNRPDANHRYTTSRDVRDQMVARGYIAEGYGNDAVIMCAAG